MAITERIAVVFDGDAKGAVGAAKQTAAATDKAAAAEEKAAAAKANLAKANLTTEKSAISLAGAQKQLAKVTADASASDEKKRKAALAVREAELKHSEASRLAGVAERQAAKAATQHAAALEHTGDAAKESSAGLKEHNKLLLAGAAAAGLAAAKFATSAVFDLGSTRSRLQGQLGLTAEDAGRYGKLAGKLYSENFGGSVAEVADALAKVRQSSKQLQVATDNDLKTITGDVLNVASTFDEDLNKVIDATGKLLANGLAPNARAALDIVVKGFQSGANANDDFLDTLSEYPPQFAKLGVGGQQALGLLNQGLKAGARNTDIVADAFKEFSIRAIDGSKLTAQGFRTLGLDAGEMGQRIAVGGKSANDALDLTLDRLRAIPDPVLRSQAAVALFGTQAEDLGSALFALDPSKAVAGLGQVGGAAERLGDALGDNPRARIDAFMRTLKTGATEAAGGALKQFNALNPELKAGAGGLLGVAVAAKAAAVAIPVVTARTGQLVDAIKGLKGGGLVASGALAALGVTAGVLTERLNKGKRGTRDFLAALDEAAGATTVTQQIEARRKAILDTNEATKLSGNEKFRYILSIKELQKQLDIESRAQKIVGEETHKAGQVFGAAGTYVDKFGQTVDKTTGKITDQKTETEQLTYAIDKLNGANIDAAQAQLSFQSSLDTLRTSVDDNGKAIDGVSQKGRENRKAFLDAAEAAITFSERVGEKSGYDAGRAALIKSQEELRKTGVQLGLSRAEVDKLIAAYLKIPPAKQTKVELDIERAKKNAADIQKQISGVKGQRVDILVTAGGSIQRIQREIDALTGRVVAIQVGQVGHGARGFSKGGEVKGGIPGKDSVPALLTPGEYVLTQEQTRGLRLGAGIGRAAGTEPPVNVVLQVQPGGMVGLERIFLSWLQQAIRTRGGTVQSVLGGYRPGGTV